MTVTVSESIGRVEAVLEAARGFRDARAQHMQAVARFTRGSGQAAAARSRRDQAIQRLVDAVEELDR